MDISFGARLRLQREQRSVALRTIADQTKIKLSLLEGLERDDVSHWPAGIFRRSYFRAYAQAIGLEPDSAVREFLDHFPDPLEEITAVLAEARNGTGDRRPATRLRYLIDSAVGALPALRTQTVPKALFLSTNDAADDSPAAIEPVHHERVRATPLPSFRVDFQTVAALCTRLGRVADAQDIAPMLAGVAAALDAVGLIVWVWDARERGLGAVLAHGYSADVLRQLPLVQPDTDTAIGASFRSAELRVVEGEGTATGAVVVPMITPAGCAGVLGLELRPPGEQDDDVRAAATILAAQFATLVGSPALAHAVSA